MKANAFDMLLNEFGLPGDMDKADFTDEMFEALVKKDAEARVVLEQQRAAWAAKKSAEAKEKAKWGFPNARTKDVAPRSRANSCGNE